jgi:predicted DNA-binding transcriptional regulator YafY
MPRKSPADLALRRRALIGLLSVEGGLSVDEMLERMPGRPGRRTLHEDLAFLRSSFPEQLVRIRAGDAHGTSRVAFQWQGPIPHLLAKPISWLSENELLALVAARGLLHTDDQAFPVTRGTARSIDGLAGAVHHLIHRTNLTDVAQRLGRHLVSVSRFGAAPIASQVLEVCMAAAASSQSISLLYTNLDGVTTRRVIAPQRLVLIRGEWYCVAWDGLLRMFRLARMIEVAISRTKPKGMPTHISSEAVDDLLAESFFATGNPDPQRRRRVVLAVSPGAWPFIQGRSWGVGQKIDAGVADLEPGWRRLSFTTTGLAECRYWILGMGTGVKAEKPKELVDWLSSAGKSVAMSYSQQS